MAKTTQKFERAEELERSQEAVASGFLCSCQRAEWFLSEYGVFVPCWVPWLLCHWDRCLFKRLACQTESATDS